MVRTIECRKSNYGRQLCILYERGNSSVRITFESAEMKINKCISLLGLLIFLFTGAYAQPTYNRNDSILIFSYLNKAEEFFGNADYKNALQTLQSKTIEY